jgi:hypothetical protein
MTTFSKKTIGIIAIAAIIGTPAAWALGKETIPYTQGEKTDVPSFESFAFRGGGEVRISHDTAHTVTIVSGHERLRIVHDGDSLKVECKKPCRSSGKNKNIVEVTAPALEDIALVGGGLMTVEGDFPLADEVNIAIVGGGRIDAFDLPGKEVNASITGGGRISVSAEDDLSAAIVGGGKIDYKGDPKVSRSIIGGGAITSAD